MTAEHNDALQWIMDNSVAAKETDEELLDTTETYEKELEILTDENFNLPTQETSVDTTEGNPVLKFIMDNSIAAKEEAEKAFEDPNAVWENPEDSIETDSVWTNQESVLDKVLNNPEMINTDTNIIDNGLALTPEQQAVYDAQVAEEKGLTNAFTQAMFKHVPYNILHAPQHMASLLSLIKERTQPEFIFGKSNPEDVYIADTYTPEGIRTDGEQLMYSLSRNFGEMMYMLGTTALGGGVGALFGGAGAVPGAALGRTYGVGSVAASMAVESYKEDNAQYLAEGKDVSEAFDKAVGDAVLKGAVEFGEGWLTLGLRPFKALGVNTGKLVGFMKKLFSSGDVKVAKEGLQMSEKGRKAIYDFLSNVVKGARNEFIEEDVQEGWDVGRHREEGQSWGQALWENKGDILKAGAMGAIGGGIGVGAGIGLGKGIQVAGTALEEKVNGRKRNEYKEAVEFVNKDIEREKELESEPEVEQQEQQEKEPIQEPKPIGDEYGEEIEGTQKVDAQGDTVLTPEPVKETKEETVAPVEETTEETVAPVEETTEETTEETVAPVEETTEETVVPVEETTEETVVPVEETDPTESFKKEWENYYNMDTNKRAEFNNSVLELKDKLLKEKTPEQVYADIIKNPRLTPQENSILNDFLEETVKHNTRHLKSKEIDTINNFDGTITYYSNKVSNKSQRPIAKIYYRVLNNNYDFKDSLGQKFKYAKLEDILNGKFNKFKNFSIIFSDKAKHFGNRNATWNVQEIQNRYKISTPIENVSNNNTISVDAKPNQQNNLNENTSKETTEETTPPVEETTQNKKSNLLTYKDVATITNEDGTVTYYANKRKNKSAKGVLSIKYILRERVDDNGTVSYSGKVKLEDILNKPQGNGEQFMVYYNSTIKPKEVLADYTLQGRYRIVSPTENVSVDAKLNQQNNLNENTPPQTIEQRISLSKTRKKISKAKKFNNTEEENLIPGSVSDVGYMPIDGQPLDGNGFSKKDELPSTPTTAKNNIKTHNDETKEAFEVLGIDENNEVENVNDDNTNYVVKNKFVSRFHKYYAIKNLIESIGIKVAGKGEEVFKLYTKAELTRKEKAMTGIEQNVMGYVKTAENNVIRISNSRDYATNIHEMFHHLIYQLKYGFKELQDPKLREELERLHKKLETIHPRYTLDELMYLSQGKDIIPEYACNLAGAYITDDIKVSKELQQFFDTAFERLGVTKELNLAKQIFRDWNAIRNSESGDLDVTINDSRAARLLAKGQFDTTNLNDAELTFYNKFKSNIKSIPGTLLAGVFNETWQLEMDARRSKNTRTLTKANQALLNVSKIEDAFFMGTGGYFHNGIFTKLHGNYAIDNLTKIQNEVEKIGKEYPDRLNALLQAKQTIGENLGNQAKADYLMKMAKDLGYKHWLDAWEDLRLVSKFFQKNVYQNIKVTNEEWTKLTDKINKIKEKFKGKYNVTTTRYLNVTNETKNRINNIIEYAQKGNKELAILDKSGSYNTGMSLGAAINVITSLQNDPHLEELLNAEDKVRKFINALDNLMSTSDVSSALRIAAAKQDTGAWYIPLIRFIDENEEKAKGASPGNSLRSRTSGGSNREIVDIFTSIENSVRSVAKQVCTNQAIDYIMKLKEEPIFAQYIREIPQSSKEVSADMTQVFANKISALNKELRYYEVTGEKVSPERLTFIKDTIKKLREANKQLEETGAVDKDAYVDLFILQPPTNRNVIQRSENDGKVHYYLVDDRIKSFLYDQRKTLSSMLNYEVINRNEAVKNILGMIFKFNKMIHLLCRASFTIVNPGFQTTNFSRDSADVALKTQEDAYSKGILLPVYYTKNMAGIAELIARSTTAKGREDFRRIVDMYSSAGQTQYAEGEHNINYLDYTVNKKGKIVRGGFNGMLSMVTEVLSNTDMLPRIVAIQQYAKKKGIDLETIDMTFADYSSLNGTKRVLSKYYKADDIERILGKDKREMWDNTPDNEYFAYVPEEFEQRQLSELIKDKYDEIERNFDIDTYSEMQELFDKSSIDFSRGTPIARTLGKICLFANTRLQGGYQLFQYVSTHKKTATGAIASMATMALLAVISGLDDDEASDEDRARGINLKINGKRFRIPTQSLIIYPYNLFRGLFKAILDSDGIDDIKSDLITALGDNSWEAISQPTGVTAIALNSTSIFYTGKNFNFGDTEKYHKFTPYQVEKMGSNVDRLIKKGDSVLAYTLTKWLVDNGCSKISTHELERYLEGFWGSAEKQVESLLGMRLVLEDKDVDVKWLDWKISIADSFLATATKQYLPNEQPFSKDIDYLRTASKNFLSVYDRLTGQIGTKADDRMWPYELYSNGEITEEDMNKYEELLAKSEIAKEYNDHIKYMTNILYSINTEKKGGQKAYNELASQIKKIAKQYKKVLTGKLNEEDIDINDEDLDYILEENEEAPEEDSILKRVFD